MRKKYAWMVAVATITVGSFVWNRSLNTLPDLALPAPAPLPSPNAYDDFVRAASLHREPEWDTKTGKMKPLSPRQVDAVFADNAAAIRAMESGFRHPLQTPSLRKSSDCTLAMKKYGAIRSLERTLAFETRQRASRGDAAGAMTDALDGIEMGAMLPRGGNLMSALVGFACEAIARRYSWPLVSRLTADQAASAARRLESIDAKRTPLADTLTEEKWCGLTEREEMIRHRSLLALYHEPLFGNISIASASDDPTHFDARRMFGGWAALAFLSKRQFLQNYVTLCDADIASARLPYTAPRQRRDDTGPPHTDLLNQTLYFYTRAVEFKESANRMEHDSLLLALALHAYRLRNGSYPDSLEKLVQSGLITRIPDDPFAPRTGVPFPYRRVSTDKYLLYSVGPDGIDQGGRPVPAKPNRRRDDLESEDQGDYVQGVNIV